MLMLKRHTILKQAVDDYSDSIRKLSDRAQRMFREEHPHGLVLTLQHRVFRMEEARTSLVVSCYRSEEIIRRQGQVDKQYAGLKELAEDRRKKLDHTFHHFLLSREVEDLEHWISERDVVASSQEMGQDLDHVTVTQPVCFHSPHNHRLFTFIRATTQERKKKKE